MTSKVNASFRQNGMGETAGPVQPPNTTEAALATMLLAVLVAGRLRGRRLLAGERIDVALVVMRLLHL